MAILNFNYADVKEQWEHALASPDHSISYDEQYEAVGDKCFEMDYDDILKVVREKKLLKPALHLVKDDGIYILSNGTPRMLITKKSPNGKHDMKVSKVVYARGYDPSKGDVWDKCRDAVGGDDFVELINHETCKKLFEFTPEQAKTLRINFTAKQISFSIRG